jgi:hypothetical protein
MSTFGLVLVVDIVVEVTDAVVVFVVLWGESNQTCNGWLAAVPYEAAGCIGLLNPGMIEESKKIIMRNGRATDARNFKLILEGRGNGKIQRQLLTAKATHELSRSSNVTHYDEGSP